MALLILHDVSQIITVLEPKSYFHSWNYALFRYEYFAKNLQQGSCFGGLGARNIISQWTRICSRRKYSEFSKQLPKFSKSYIWKRENLFMFGTFIKFCSNLFEDKLQIGWTLNIFDIFLNIQIPSGIAATNQKDRKIIRKVALLHLPLTHDLEILDPESAIFAPKMSSNNLSRRQCL